MEELSSVDLHSREVTSHGRRLKPLHHLSVDLDDVSRSVDRARVRSRHVRRAVALTKQWHELSSLRRFQAMSRPSNSVDRKNTPGSAWDWMRRNHVAKAILT
jgi:hypothetical protein